jgi:peptidoglycan/xylan/chitin deacetylase (PgdA/CDA1 family)
MRQKEKSYARRFKSFFSKRNVSIILLVMIIIATGIFDFTYKSTTISVVKNLRPYASPSKEIDHGDLSKKQVIFTFDAGEGVQSGEKILVVLAKHHVKGTFFMTGKFVGVNPVFVKKVADAGHEIFDHTYDHPHLTAVTGEEIVTELDKMSDILASTTGVLARPYFRAPYGDRDTRVLGEAFKDGYQSVYWTVDAHDWEESTGVTASEVTDRIISNLRPGNIYLMHVGDNITGEVLDSVFTMIEDKGYKIVSLTECL